MEKDQQFVEMVVRELVDTPDKVKVERKVDEMGVLITLAVDPSDMGKIIGKEGRTAKAIRTLLRVLGAKNNSRVNLKIEEPEGGSYVPKEESRDEQPGEQHDMPAMNDAHGSGLHDTGSPLEMPMDVAIPHQPEEPQQENPTSIL